MKKVAIFDIDGTIFRSSLLIEITEALIQEGIFPEKAEKIYSGAFKNWLDRKGSYDEYIHGVIDAFEKYIVGIKESDFSRIAKRVVAFHKNRVYRFTRDLVAELHEKNYYIIAISNSPKETVDEFCKTMGFDRSYGRIYATDKNGKLNGETLHLELMRDKAKLLKFIAKEHGFSLKGSVGVGDSEADIPFLKLVDRPICFNPNSKLYAHARRAGWEIVVERKDVVYHLQ
ncbi:MAG: HAD family phosphatase [bacterium]|nr:HAD family phosphatase [Candidatus Jorgensenbacteria bacterium]